MQYNASFPATQTALWEQNGHKVSFIQLHLGSNVEHVIDFPVDFSHLAGRVEQPLERGRGLL